MAGYNSSNAYDLSAFDPAQAQKNKPEMQVVKNNRKLTSAFSPKTISAFAIVVTLVCLMVYNQVQLTEITGEINDLTQEIGRLDSDIAEKTSALESTVSLDQVKKLAQAMGMQPRSEFQTKYIYLYQQDIIERPKEAAEPTTTQEAKLTITSLLEYLPD